MKANEVEVRDARHACALLARSGQHQPEPRPAHLSAGLESAARLATGTPAAHDLVALARSASPPLTAAGAALPAREPSRIVETGHALAHLGDDGRPPGNDQRLPESRGHSRRTRQGACRTVDF